MCVVHIGSNCPKCRIVKHSNRVVERIRWYRNDVEQMLAIPAYHSNLPDDDESDTATDSRWDVPSSR